MKKLKIGIVGLRRGNGFVGVFSHHPEVEVAALCDIDPKVLADTGKAFNLPDSSLYLKYDDFVNAPLDIVMIATAIPYHTDQTVKALESGKHVLCEQTVAYTFQECQKVLETVRKTGKKYMMAENYTYFHFIRQWKEMIDQGRLGDIVYAESEYIHEILPMLENKRTGEFFWRADRPPIWYCAHCLGPLLTLMDDRVVKVVGMHSGFHRFPDRTDKPGFLDMEVGLFHTEKGKVIKILRSQTPVRNHMAWYSLYGTKGSVESSRLNEEGGMLYIPKEMGAHDKAQSQKYSIVDPDAPEIAKTGGHGTSEYFMIRDFIESIKNDTTPPLDIIRAIDFTVPGIIAHQSALAGGKLMDVPVYWK